MRRLEKELAESRAREHTLRHEAMEARERFDRLLGASSRFTRALSERKRQYQASRRYLAAQRAVDAILVEADDLERVTAGVLKALGENLGREAAVFWVIGDGRLRCAEIWHRPNAFPDGLAEACRRKTLARGEGLPGRAWAENGPVWDGVWSPKEWSDEPVGGLRGAVAFPVFVGGGASGVVELVGGENPQPDQELLYTMGLIGRRLGQFAERRRAATELGEAEEWLRLATEAGRVGLLDWNVPADEIRCSGAMAEIYGYPSGGFNPTYEGFLARVHPEDRAGVRHGLDAAVAAGTPYELEFRIIRPEGDVRAVRSKGGVHRNEEGIPARVVGVALDVTEQKQAELERDRLHSLEAVAQAEATERERISRELHDRVAHSMGVAHQSLQLYEALAEKDPARAQGRLGTAKEMTRTALEQTRNLSAELRRSETEDGLVPALQDLLEVVVPQDVDAEFSASGAESSLSDHQRGQLYLILREAVRNAVAHSGCRHLTVGLDITPENVSSFVEDDGSGFEGNGGNGDGIGLRSIQERAALLKGEAEVYDPPQGGAGVRILLPLRKGGG